MAENQQNQLRLERAVHRTLLGGVLLSGAFMLLGLALVLTQRIFDAGATSSSTLEYGTSLIDGGILLLMLTPLVRVAVLAIGWLWTGERTFAAVALAVLALLGWSLILGVR